MKVSLIATLALTLLGIGVARAQAKLPEVVDVAVPGGGTLHVTVPPGSCSYPKEVRDRLAQFLASREPPLQLLGAAGDCESMDRFLKDGISVIAHSLQVAMLESEANPTERSTPAAYRRSCFEHYPKKKTDNAADTLRQAVKDADRNLILGEEKSLGLVAATRDAVFGGTLTEVTRASRQLLMVQVTACFAPGDKPLLWMFQDVVDRSAGDDSIAETLRSVLALARSQVKTTIERNRADPARQ